MFRKITRKQYNNAYVKYKDMPQEQREFEKMLLKIDVNGNFIISIIVTVATIMIDGWFGLLDSEIVFYVKGAAFIILMVLLLVFMFLFIRSSIRLEVLTRIEDEQKKLMKRPFASCRDTRNTGRWKDACR